MSNVIPIAQKLISFPSVTPADAGAQDYLISILEELGFTIYKLPFGGDNGEARIENFFARLGTEAPHICYAGHTDVVPTGPEEKWTTPPFAATITDGVMIGRGASDMKGSVACWMAALQEYLGADGAPEKGSISVLITGDEEADAINGTVKVLEWMDANGHIPDVCLVGEPTNPKIVGEEVKIGRRGSLSGVISVSGKQGHVAYQDLADNPLPRLISLCDALANFSFDTGNEYFPATNLEITTIDVGNTASNVIPGAGSAIFNVRYNDIWDGDSLSAKVREILDATGHDYSLELREGAHSFMTKPGAWSDLVMAAVSDVTGMTPAITTNGGTSDARFVSRYCPVIEFGGVNESVHQIDENAKVEDLEIVTKVFTRVLERYFS